MLNLIAFAFWICTGLPVFGRNSLKCEVFTVLFLDIEHVGCVLTAYKALLSTAVSPQIYLKISFSAQNLLNQCFSAEADPW